MKTTIAITTFIFAVTSIFGQDTTLSTPGTKTSAERIMDKSGKLQIGGYAQIDYNQPINSETKNPGNLDVHRLVMLLGYRFNEKTQFITEIEYEHVSEVYVEQAFLDYKIKPWLTFRGGLLLIPMGIVNEYHEPPTFNGVERPLIDNRISPTTWREIGAGFTGNIIDASLKYQAYVVNGFNGYDDKPLLNGKDALRSGRQKGAESYMSSPNFTAKVEYYGISGLNLGISGYFGNTQSSAYTNVSKSDENALKSADSSVVGIAMTGVDARYSISGIQLRGQFYFVSISNTDQYNPYTAVNGVQNDLGSSMIGYYAEAAYNVFYLFDINKTELIPFVRYEQYNTHQSVSGNVIKNDAYNVNQITTGIGWKITPGAMLKCDFEFKKAKSADEFSKVFNAGVAVMF